MKRREAIHSQRAILASQLSGSDKLDDAVVDRFEAGERYVRGRVSAQGSELVEKAMKDARWMRIERGGGRRVVSPRCVTLVDDGPHQMLAGTSADERVNPLALER